jgi:hypothetical protein
MWRYTHTQEAQALRVALFGGAVVALLVAILELVPPVPAWLLAAILIGCAVIFSSLTIRVTDQALVWHFGLGLFRKTVPLAEIATAELARTRWIDGWGIHRTRRGWLYNVSGFDAVLVTRRDGTRFLLGTDEPERLRLAILQGLEIINPTHSRPIRE